VCRRRRPALQCGCPEERRGEGLEGKEKNKDRLLEFFVIHLSLSYYSIT